MTVHEEFEPSGCVCDLEGRFSEGSWVTAPLSAWRSRNRALIEIVENPWTLATDETFAFAAYHQKTSPWRTLGSIVGTSTMALLTARGARS